MVSRKSRNSRQRRHHTPYKQRSTSTYSHINIRAATDIGEGIADALEEPGDFIRKDSLQDNIAQELAYANKIASRFGSESPTGSHPTTFAEATMSTRVHDSVGRGNSNKVDGFDVIPTRSKPVESLGTLKYTKKKKVQKWSPLDFSAAERASEVGNIFDVGTSRDASPNSMSLVPYQSQPGENPATLSSTTPTGKGKGASAQDPYCWVDADSTPKQARFDLSALVPYTYNDPGLYEYSASLDPVDPNFADSPETKTKFASIMAHLNQYVSPTPTSTGGDAFDSLNWDPDLPSISTPDKSPERVTAKPKAIAYTTVGSLVNPNIVPQFAAPNRIQREGAGRRPLMAMSNRQYENLFQSRGPPPPLNMQNSMHYTQQLLQASPITHNSPPKLSVPVSRHLHPNMIQLTEQEKQALGQVGEAIPRKAQLSLSTRALASSIRTSSNTAGGTNQTFRLRDLLDEDDLNRPYGAQGLTQGLEKMQTLQRLARFENPMREHALNRLSEFSVANANANANANTQTASKGAVNTPTLSFESMLRNNQPHSLSTTNSRTSYQGELNRGYQFPPPGITPSSTTQANPLFRACSATAYHSTAPLSRPPGYPQPLTAGPPGQRQSNGFQNQGLLSDRASNIPSNNFYHGDLSQSRPNTGFTAPANPDFNPELFLPGFVKNGYLSTSSSSRVAPSYDDNIQGLDSGARSCYQPEAPTQSPWGSRLQVRPQAPSKILTAQAVAPTELGPHTMLRDTLPPCLMAKYYPHGLPIIGPYAPLATGEQMGDIPSDEANPEQKAKKEKENDDFFYFGQRRYHMTAEQHIEELERRQPPPTNPFGPIGPPGKDPAPVIMKPFTVEGMKEMSIPEAAAPVIDALFATMLGHAESSSTSRTKLSGWVKAPVRYIDDTVEGNKSMFGEDWGSGKPAASRTSSRGCHPL